MASTGVRSYLAGTGASGSLLLAGLVALVSVTAFVGFDAVPFGSGDAGSGTVALERGNGGSAAPAAAAAAAAAGAPAAVAGAPAAPADGPGTAPAAGTAAIAAAPPPGGAPGATGTPGGGSATQTDVPPAAAPTPTSGPTNPVDDLVAGVDQTVESTTGVNPNLGGATKPVTGLVDQTVQGLTGNNLGGHLDNLGLRPQP